MNIKEDNGLTALMLAGLYEHVCSSSGPDLFKQLLTKPELDVNATDNYGLTALMMLLSNKQNNLNCIQSLIEHPDINVNIKDNQSNTALIFAARK